MPADSDTDGTGAARPPARRSRGGSRRARTVSAGPVWIRPTAEKAERLTLEMILATAIRLADAEGLGAVSVRRVAAELKVRPMSLYSFVSRMDDLVELMVDQVVGEMLLDRLPDDWQDALRAITRRTYEVGRRHPWLMVALGQRPSIGPNAVRHLEQSLAAIASLDLSPERTHALLLAVEVYTIGAGTAALSGQQMRRQYQMTEEEWRASTEEYFAQLTATQDLPHLAKLRGAELLRRDEHGDTFEEGFNWLLAGFAATL